MLQFIYIVSALTAMVCAVLLLRGYWRSGVRLLLWSGLCFIGLTLDNLMLFADMYYPGFSFNAPRNVAAIVGLAALIYGMIWDAK